MATEMKSIYGWLLVNLLETANDALQPTAECGG